MFSKVILLVSVRNIWSVDLKGIFNVLNSGCSTLWQKHQTGDARHAGIVPAETEGAEVTRQCCHLHNSLCSSYIIVRMGLTYELDFKVEGFKILD